MHKRCQYNPIGERQLLDGNLKIKIKSKYVELDHCGASLVGVVSPCVSQEEGPGFNSRTGQAFCLEFTCSPCVCAPVRPKNMYNWGLSWFKKGQINLSDQKYFYLNGFLA